MSSISINNMARIALKIFIEKFNLYDKEKFLMQYLNEEFSYNSSKYKKRLFAASRIIDGVSYVNKLEIYFNIKTNEFIIIIFDSVKSAESTIKFKNVNNSGYIQQKIKKYLK